MEDFNSHDIDSPTGYGDRNTSEHTQVKVLKNFRCVGCSKVLSSKHCLQEHEHTHTDEKPYTCGICMKKFKFASQFSLHKKLHQSTRELRWPKLTDLFNVRSKKIKLAKPHIKIELPMITGPSLCQLPGFSFR